MGVAEEAAQTLVGLGVSKVGDETLTRVWELVRRERRKRERDRARAARRRALSVASYLTMTRNARGDGTGRETVHLSKQKGGAGEVWSLCGRWRAGPDPGGRVSIPKAIRAVTCAKCKQQAERNLRYRKGKVTRS